MVIPNQDEKREIQGWPKLHLLGEDSGRWGEEGEAETAGENQTESNERSRNRSNHSRASLDQRKTRKPLKPLGNVKPKQCFT